MTNSFEIFVETSTGAPAASIQVELFADAGLSAHPTTVPPVADGLFTTDSNGMIAVEVTGLETIYARVVGQTAVTAWRSLNAPVFTDLTADDVIGDTAEFPYSEDGVNKRIDKVNLKTQLGIPTDYVKSDGSVLTIRAGTAAVNNGTGVNGDIYIRVPT
jgi:hypothetical protein